MALRAGISSPGFSPPVLHAIRSSAGGRSGPPATASAELPQLEAVFRRRLLAGIGTASLVALGANLGGITSLLLGFTPELGRSLKLDVLYPVQGFTRCLDYSNGFEFIYPESWVGDQTLLYRAIDKAEQERALDPPPLANEGSSSTPQSRRSVSEPVAAFGPPGSSGELNVSVIVSPISRDFSIEDFGGPKEIGERVLRRIAGSRRGSNVTATLVDATLREDTTMKVKYYKLEFLVESPSFRRRHNVALCCARDGKLFTLNAQAPESVWPTMKEDFCKIADSFHLIEV